MLHKHTQQKASTQITISAATTLIGQLKPFYTTNANGLAPPPPPPTQNQSVALPPPPAIALHYSLGSLLVSRAMIMGIAIATVATANTPFMNFSGRACFISTLDRKLPA